MEGEEVAHFCRKEFVFGNIYTLFVPFLGSSVLEELLHESVSFLVLLKG